MSTPPSLTPPGPATGFNDMATTMRLGAICGVASFLIWAVVGGVWWNVIGLNSVAAQLS